MIVTEKTQEFVEAMNHKFADDTFHFESTAGRNYDKVICSSVSHNGFVSRNVHAFIERKSNGLLKAASWAAPAKGIRFDLSESVENAVLHADKHGAYLYAR